MASLASSVVGLILCACIRAWAGSAPSVPMPPPFLHVTYAVTRNPTGDVSAGGHPTGAPTLQTPVEYFAAAPKCARWTVHWKAGAIGEPISRSIMTDGVTWMDFWTEARVTSLNIYSANSWASYNRNRQWRSNDVYHPGLIASDIPFLGFRQPGKMYGGAGGRLVRTADGCFVRCRVPQGFLREGQGYDSSGDFEDDMSRGVSDRRAMVDARLTFDRQGRLVRFQRDLPDAGGVMFYEKYEYGDFAALGGGASNRRAYVPRIVRFSEQLRANDRTSLWYVDTYRATSIDTAPLPHDLFTLQRPPQGTQVVDFRYHFGAGTRPDKFSPLYRINGKGALTYKYTGDLSLDEESRRQYDASRVKGPVPSGPAP